MKERVIPIVIGALGVVTLGTGTGRHGNKSTRRDNSNYNIIKISQNTENNSGDLRRLAVFQSPLSNRQKNLKRVLTIKDYIKKIKERIITTQKA